MKMDAYHHIQLGSVYRGHESLSSDEVIKIYNGTHVPLYIMDDHMHREGNPRNLVHFLDSFSVPEVALFADISDVRQSLIIQAVLNSFSPHPPPPHPPPLVPSHFLLLHLFLLTSPLPLVLFTSSSSFSPHPCYVLLLFSSFSSSSISIYIIITYHLIQNTCIWM